MRMMGGRRMGIEMKKVCGMVEIILYYKMLSQNLNSKYFRDNV